MRKSTESNNLLCSVRKNVGEANTEKASLKETMKQKKV
jgi:hypothetical protein